jgi:hypothetical protein
MVLLDKFFLEESLNADRYLLVIEEQFLLFLQGTGVSFQEEFLNRSGFDCIEQMQF